MVCVCVCAGIASDSHTLITIWLLREGAVNSRFSLENTGSDLGGFGACVSSFGVETNTQRCAEARREAKSGTSRAEEERETRQGPCSL